MLSARFPLTTKLKQTMVVIRFVVKRKKEACIDDLTKEKEQEHDISSSFLQEKFQILVSFKKGNYTPCHVYNTLALFSALVKL